MSPQGPPHYASLLIGGRQYETLEFSAAGLSLARSAVEASELAALQRGDECEATLCLGAGGWEESYDVVLRLAARGPAHIGLAFVTLPPTARRLLRQVAVDQDKAGPEASSFGSSDFGGSPWGGRPAPFAFARLVEREAPSRRLVLSASEAVFVLTKRRNRENGPRPKATLVRSLPVSASPAGAVASESGLLPASALFAYGAVLLAVLALFWTVVVG